MRKSATAMALAVTAALLAGCGGGAESGDGGGDGGAKTAATAAPSAKPKGDAKADGPAVGPTREVTIEVAGGEGSTQVYYNLGDDNGAEQVSLPWKKTAKVTLKGAEIKAGSLVSVAPGSVKGSDGMLKAASCVITVEGKKVADNQDGALPKPCEYQLK
ncbi:hypothetical protein ABZ442_08605 [Streptomyces triculaminicus]|uniref:hypothetical protein n=1 Tax=Streptomyces triculaminicus TaxID=2816232 RepID=UPI0033D3ADE2